MTKELHTLAVKPSQAEPADEELGGLLHVHFNGNLPPTDEGLEGIRKRAWTVIKHRMANSGQTFDEQFLEDHLGKNF